MSFTIGSLFDGSGGFPLAAFMCGGVPVWASEVEPYPIAVTKTRFPYMKHLGSVTDINGAEIEPVDVISFGSPCQDLSVAGKRAGLKHEANGDEETTRSGLFMEAVRIIKEMKEATNGVYPRFALWENVPGAFSSNKGEDFRIVLEELIKIVEPSAVMPAVPKSGWAYADHYCGDGWSLAYRTLDSQYWGVPQRRKRVFLILDLGGQCAGEVLFERQGLRGYFEEGRTPWQTVTGDAKGGSGTADCERYSVIAIDQQGGKGGANYAIDVMPTICSDSHGTPHAVAYSFEPGIAAREGGHIYEGVSGTLRANAGDNQMAVAMTEALPFDTTQVTSPMNYSSPKWGDPCHPLAAGAHPPAVVCCIDGDKIGKAERAGGSGLGIRDGDTMYTLTAKDVHGVCVPINDKATRWQGGGATRNHDGSGNGLGVGKDGDPSPTLTAGDRHAVAYGIGNGQANQSFMEERTGALNCMHDQQAVCYGVDCRSIDETPVVLDRAFFNQGQNALYDPQCYVDGTCPTLVAKGPAAVCVRYIVRRLTPTECCRLQGFPDFWGHPDHKDSFTDEEYDFWLNVRNTHAEINGKAVKDYTKAQMLTWYNKLHTDSSEYKMWGNGVALPCVLYLMEGIADVFKAMRVRKQ